VFPFRFTPLFFPSFSRIHHHPSPIAVPTPFPQVAWIPPHTNLYCLPVTFSRLPLRSVVSVFYSYLGSFLDDFPCLRLLPCVVTWFVRSWHGDLIVWKLSTALCGLVSCLFVAPLTPVAFWIFILLFLRATYHFPNARRFFFFGFFPFLLRVFFGASYFRFVT